MQLFLIRHAQSANNAKPEHERIPDPPITAVGRQQADRLAESIDRLKLTRLISSPFLRALQTTAPLHEATGLVPHVRAEWHEEGGCYSGHIPGQLRGEPGMTRAEIETRFPGYLVHDEIDDRGWWRRQPWETTERSQARARRVLKAVCDEFRGASERVAFVTHADFKCHLLRLVHDDWIDVPRNTSVTTLEITDDSARLVDFNRVDHLPGELQTF